MIRSATFHVEAGGPEAAAATAAMELAGALLLVGAPRDVHVEARQPFAASNAPPPYRYAVTFGWADGELDARLGGLGGVEEEGAR